jgi:hypothetical protein
MNTQKGSIKLTDLWIDTNRGWRTLDRWVHDHASPLLRTPAGQQRTWVGIEESGELIVLAAASTKLVKENRSCRWREKPS